VYEQCALASLFPFGLSGNNTNRSSARIFLEISSIWSQHFLFLASQQEQTTFPLTIIPPPFPFQYYRRANGEVYSSGPFFPSPLKIPFFKFFYSPTEAFPPHFSPLRNPNLFGFFHGLAVSSPMHPLSITPQHQDWKIGVSPAI